MKFKTILRGLLPFLVWIPLMGLAEPAAAPADSGQVSAAAQSELVVKIEGIRTSSGVIRIGLFKNRASYEDTTPNSPRAFRRAILPIKNGTAQWRIEVPYGVYAIKLYHDEDNSGKLKRSLVGRPKEGVGFSNNPKLGNKAPDFDEVKFTVGQPQSSSTIQMINP
jgi:uncharacterized protein (DUF2141 family)